VTLDDVWDLVMDLPENKQACLCNALRMRIAERLFGKPYKTHVHLISQLDDSIPDGLEKAE